MRRILYLQIPHLQTTLEQQADASLAERSLLVVARALPTSRQPSAVGRQSLKVLDASDAALAEGVTLGMAARVAARRCPEAVVLVREWVCYEPVAVAIGNCLAEQTPWVERVAGSSDEFFADLGEGDAEEGMAVARSLAERIGAEFGLAPRLTLATGRFVARAAGSDPFCHLIPAGSERCALRELGIEALYEARPEVRRRLPLLGVRTLGQLAAVPRRWLVDLFGPAGWWYGMLARGVDPRRVRAWAPAPSITATCALPDGEIGDEQLDAYLMRLAKRIARRLVNDGAYARTVTVTLALDGRRHFFASRALKAPTNLARVLMRTGKELSTKLQVREFADKTLSLSVGNLESQGVLQLDIFGDVDRGPALRAAIARIQERFGETAIGPLERGATPWHAGSRRRSA